MAAVVITLSGRTGTESPDGVTDTATPARRALAEVCTVHVLLVILIFIKLMMRRHNEPYTTGGLCAGGGVVARQLSITPPAQRPTGATAGVYATSSTFPNVDRRTAPARSVVATYRDAAGQDGPGRGPGVLRGS